VLLVILLVGAVGAFYIAQKVVPAPTPSTLPTPTPTATSAPTSLGPLTVVSVSILQPHNPGGPTIEVILQNNATNPVISLQAALTLSGHNYTYVFESVSKTNPLLPNQYTSQKETLINAGFETNQTYPMQITGTLQNGTYFDFTTPITIIQSNQVSSSGSKGDLELTITIDKTTYNVGEPVNITLTITNISKQTINFTHTGLDFDFQVSNDTNNIVYQWSKFKFIPQFMAIEALHAGYSISSNLTWPQICNFNTQVQDNAASPGTYNIIGETGPTYGIQTTPIQMAILEP
jgi:hypothetical protein